MRGTAPTIGAAELADLKGRLRTRAERKLILARAGVPQRAIARELNVHDSTVSLWLSGDRTPEGANLRGFVRILDDLERVAEARVGDD